MAEMCPKRLFTFLAVPWSGSGYLIRPIMKNLIELYRLWPEVPIEQTESNTAFADTVLVGMFQCLKHAPDFTIKPVALANKPKELSIKSIPSALHGFANLTIRQSNKSKTHQMSSNLKSGYVNKRFVG